MGHHIWECRHNLLFGGQVCTLLELKVANGAGQSKVAIDTAKINEATSCDYSCLFTCKQLADVEPGIQIWRTFVLRLVVKRQRFRPTFDAQNRSGVSGIGL